MRSASGLIHKRHRRGKRRRDRLRLALRLAFSLVLLGAAAGLSAGIVHMVERPLPPFEAMATLQPEPASQPPVVEEPLEGAEVAELSPTPPVH